MWRTRRSFAARGHCNRFGWRSLGFRKMGEPGAFSSGGWHVPKSGQSFESPATPLTNYCCCCSETKKKEKRETRENRMEQPLTLNSTDRCLATKNLGKSTYCDTLEVPPGPLRIRLGPHGRAGAHQAPVQAACARGRRAARCAGRAANCGPRATKIPMKLRIAAASSVACRVSASVRTRIHPAGAPGHHWGRVGACPQRDARASRGGRN